MGIENLMLTLNRVPEIKVDTGTDWVTLFGFLLTAIAVVVGALYTSYTFKKTISSQERIAQINAKALREQSKSEALSRNRQDWIISLRAELASIVSKVHDVYSLSLEVNDPNAIRGDSKAELEESNRLHGLKFAELSGALSKSRFHLANIQMHLNPAEADSIALLAKLQLLIEAGIRTQRIYDLSQDVISLSQIVLKKEWVRVKEMI